MGLVISIETITKSRLNDNNVLIIQVHTMDNKLYLFIFRKSHVRNKLQDSLGRRKKSL